MRIMLDEELARAILVGDGRQSSAEDKIKEDHIEPIWKDDDLYTIKHTFEAGDNVSVMADNFIDEAIRARKEYKGSGNRFCSRKRISSPTACFLRIRMAVVFTDLWQSLQLQCV